MQSQLAQILNTLPNLRRIVITDRRRRQDLSWFQESQIRQESLCAPTPETRPSLFSRGRRALTTQATRTWDEYIGTVPEPRGVESVPCLCFDEEPCYDGQPSGLGHADSKYMPQSPWAEVVEALHKMSKHSISTICIEPKSSTSYLPLSIFEACDPGTIRSASEILPCLTELDLRLDIVLNSNTKALGKMHLKRKEPTHFLSKASNLTSLTIDLLDQKLYDCVSRESNEYVTTFDALLGRCHLPLLTTLHLRNLTFRERELSAFLQDSPNIRNLSLQSLWMADDNDSQDDTQDLNYWQSGSWRHLLQTIKDTLPHLEYFRVRSTQYYVEENPTNPDDWEIAASPRFWFDEGIDPFAETTRSSFIL